MDSHLHLTRTASTLTAVAALGFAACGGESGESSGWTFTAETSPIGRTIAVNTPPATDEDPTWWIEEELRIGTLDDPGPTSFGEIRGLAVTDDGRIAVLETQSQELRIFRADGSHESTSGGAGGGPGEFEGAFGLMLGPDGLLYVPEVRNARMSVLHPSNGFVRSHQMRLLSFGFVSSFVMDADGRILKPSLILEEDRRPVIRVYDREMNEVEIRSLPPEAEIDPEDPPTSWAFKTENGNGYRSVPWYPRATQLLDPTGEIWSTAFGDPSYRIFRWAPGGDTTLVIETMAAEVPVTAAERDSAFAAAVAGIEAGGGTIEGDASKIPAVKPAIERMMLSAEGQLWVSRASRDGLHRFDVYDRDGRRIGGAATDVSFWPYLSPIVRGERIWAVVTDELDVPYVIRGRVVPFECRSGNPAIDEVRRTCLDAAEGRQ
jgi:hypothetical protein